MGMGMSLGCCCGGCNCPINLRSFDAADGNLLWEVKCFAALARSPDNTLWGYSVRKITTSDYRVRTPIAITVSTGSITSGGGWPTKSGTDPGATTAIACDLVKVESDGTKTVTKSGLWERAAATSTDEFSWYKSCPRMFPTSPGTRLYDATDSGVGRMAALAGAFATGPFPAPGTVYHNDPWKISKTLKMTIPPQALVAGTSPSWNFKQGATTASWSLYATAATIQTALATLPGVDTVSVTGGPCCEADVDIHIEWLSDTDNFSDAWIKNTTAIITSRIFWDWTTGQVSLISNSGGAVTSFTSDSAYVLRGTVQKRGWITSASHPWNEVHPSTNVWSNTSMAGLTQTCERNKIGAGTTWDAVPISTSITDVRDGVILIAQTRGRVPVAEPSSNAAYSHATIDESTGTLISLHDAKFNVMSTGNLDTDGTLIAYGAQYGYTYQGFDGAAPPPGNSFSSALSLADYRNHDGYNFATGTGTTMKALSLEAVSSRMSMTAGNVFIAETTPVDTVPVDEWSDTYTGVINGTEYRISGTTMTCRWVDVAAVFGVPASRRETWMFFGPTGRPSIPAAAEWRFTHNSGGSPVKTTAWFSAYETEANVDAELQLWYGEGVPGFPTIFISGTVEVNPDQTQPFFQYLPLAHIEIWNDATGATWAPRGRVLCLEIRYATSTHENAVVAMDRTDGTIIWQRDAGNAVADSTTAPWNSYSTVGGFPCYSDATQFVVSTYCR